MSRFSLVALSVGLLTCVPRVAAQSSPDQRFDLTLDAGYYTAEVTLPSGQRSGVWGMEVIANAGVLSGGFNLGGGYDRAGGNPGFAGFLIEGTQTVTATINAQALPGETAPAMSLRLLDSSRRQVGTPVTGATSAISTQVLPGGYYTVEMASSTGRGTYQLALSSNFFAGGVVVGGYISSGLTGFGAFNLPVRQQVSVRLYSTGYGAAGAGIVRLQIKDSQGRAVALPGTTDDHGNTCATATVASVGSVTAGIIGSTTDVDFFRLQTLRDSSITVYTTGTTDTTGSLYDSNCNAISSNDDTSASNLNFRISRSLAAGTYYVSVGVYARATPGAYNLNIETSGTDDHGNTCASATPATANTTVSGAVESPTDGDFFRIEVSQIVTLTVSAASSVALTGAIYDANCAVQQSGAGTASSPGVRISRSLSPGVYYVSISGVSGSLGSYTVAFQTSAGDDHGNSCDAATSVATPSATAGRIDFAADVDYFRFVVLQQGTLTVYTTGNTDTVGTLYDANCNSIVRNDDTTTTNLNFRITRVVTPGTYYAAVSLYARATAGAYSFVVEWSAALGLTGAPSGSAVTLSVTNHLVLPVTLTLNGKGQLMIPALATSDIVFYGAERMDVSWSLVQPRLPDGSLAGEPMRGMFETMWNPQGTTLLEVDNAVGEAVFYTPVVNYPAGAVSGYYKYVPGNRLRVAAGGRSREWIIGRDVELSDIEARTGIVRLRQ